MDEARALKESLARLEAESWDLYLDELRRLDVAIEEVDAPDWDTPVGQFLRSDAGTPLGPGFVSGAPIAGDEVGAHIARWMLILRLDPCAYCGARPAGTVDHIVPKRHPDRETHTWVNMTGACSSCNSNKGANPLWETLWVRCRTAWKRRLRDARRERERLAA